MLVHKLLRLSPGTFRTIDTLALGNWMEGVTPKHPLAHALGSGALPRMP